MVKKWGGDVKLQRRKRRERFIEFRNNYKRDKCCSECGWNKCPEILVFHHIRNKEIEINQISTSIKKYLEEIKKCVLLCPNCHAIKHM